MPSRQEKSFSLTPPPFYVFSTLLLCPFMALHGVSVEIDFAALFTPGIRQSVDFNHRTNPLLHICQHHNITSKDGVLLRVLSSGFICLHVSLHAVSLLPRHPIDKQPRLAESSPSGSIKLITRLRISFHPTSTRGPMGDAGPQLTRNSSPDVCS